ncbi:MAG: Vitamin B12 transporter BtuB [bacterium]|nr:Vitamin B12 transporter BtuB [bacterium]
MKLHRYGTAIAILLSHVLLVAMAGDSWAANTGKIAGRVIDRETSEPLVGVNVVVDGTTAGAATDMGGNYTVLNLPPGVYSVRASIIGYGQVVQENVKVSINQTTPLNFALSQQLLEGETVVVQAARPVVQMDVSASQRIVTAEAIQSRPLDNFEEILSTEIGISLAASTEGSGLIVRGGQLNETDIVIDGLSTRNERTQQPMTNLSLTAIQEVEILTGGFNAEFGDIRSGLVNVITKEGNLDRYTISFDGKLRPPDRKHFGPSPFGIDGPFWQVYAGAEAFTGVTQDMVNSKAYPFTFIGWNEVARQFLADTDPRNDYTPQELLEIWKWQHRTREYANKPDYIGDLSIGGKVPFSNVAFLLSQRYENLQLVYPFSRNNSIASTTLLKLTKRLSPSLKLSLNNTYILVRGVDGSIYDDTVGMITGTREGTQYARDAHFWRYIWHDANFNPIETRQYRGGLALNHLLSSKTFYDLRLEFTDFRTRQEPIALRDTAGVKRIGDTWYDEGPFGYVGSALGGGITEKYDILGEFLMSGGGRGQDHSKYRGVSLSMDLVSQVNRHNEVKLGVKFEYTDFQERREINNGATTTPVSEAPWLWWYYNESPIKLAGYVQDKLEFEGMVANVGLRLDYYNTRTQAFNLDPAFIFANNPYTLDSYRANNGSFANLTTSEGSYKLYFSPRIGVSHPINTASKIFFNYGHFLQPPVVDQLFLVRPNATGRGADLPNVAAEWPRTIAYEAGLEQGIGTDFLIHLTGYYKDVSDQLSPQNIVSLDGENDITTYANNSYADIRGLELKLEKRFGDWWYGWTSLEYLTSSEGRTGYRYLYEDRQLANRQRETAAQIKQKGVPSVTANLSFRTPADFGPKVLGHKLLGDWRLNVLQNWSDGGESLLNPDAPLKEQIWVKVVDYANTDLMLEKRFALGANRFGLYMQVNNLFDNKGFPNPFNWNKYLDSLHFPHETGSQKGNDKLGEWDKPYIDLGWNTWSQFVNPREFYFGLRIEM